MKTGFCFSLFCLALILGAPEARAQESVPVRQDPSRRVETFGDITFSGLLQGWYLSGSGDFDDTLKLRRTELKLTGVVSPKVKWTLMVDPAKTLSMIRGISGPKDESVVTSMLQDAFVTLTVHKRLNVNVGQFKVPLSLEGLQSSASLDTERALFISDRSRGGAYGDVRSVGMMAHGPLTDRLDYQVGLFDGSGDTPDDGTNYDRKAIASRLVYRPGVVPGLQVGTSRVWGTGATDPLARRDRLGAEVLYANGPLTLKAEYMTGQDGLLEREGHYASFAYKVTPKWEAIMRHDSWDPDRHLETTRASVTERDYIAGFNYLVDSRHTKMQFNCVRKTFKDGIVNSYYLGATRLQFVW